MACPCHKCPFPMGNLHSRPIDGVVGGGLGAPLQHGKDNTLLDGRRSPEGDVMDL